jgi:hypothetical protein
VANIVFNISKGKVAAYYDRVKSNDPSTSALILTPIETSGLESDANLIDSDTVAEVVDGATNKQSTMGEKVLTDADLAAIPAPDDGNDRNDRSLPTVTWTAASGNAISKILVSYRPDTGSAADATDIPLTLFDAVVTPDGNDVQLTTGVFFRAS